MKNSALIYPYIPHCQGRRANLAANKSCSLSLGTASHARRVNDSLNQGKELVNISLKKDDYASVKSRLQSLCAEDVNKSLILSL